MDILAAQQMQTKPVLPGMTVLPAGMAGAGGEMFQSLLGQLLGTAQAGMPIALPGQPALPAGSAAMPTLPGTGGIEGDGAILPAGVLLPTGPVTVGPTGIGGGTGPLPASAAGPMALIPLRPQPLAKMGGLGATGIADTGLIQKGSLPVDGMPGDLLPGPMPMPTEGLSILPVMGDAAEAKGAPVEIMPILTEGQVPVLPTATPVEPMPVQVQTTQILPQAPIQPAAPVTAEAAPVAGAGDAINSADAAAGPAPLPSATQTGTPATAPTVPPAPTASAQTAATPPTPLPANSLPAQSAAPVKAVETVQGPTPPRPATKTAEAKAAEITPATAAEPAATPAAPTGSSPAAAVAELAPTVPTDAPPPQAATPKHRPTSGTDPAQVQQAAAAQAAAQAAQAAAQAPATASPAEPQAQATPNTPTTGRTRPSDEAPGAATDGAPVEGEETAKGTLPVEEDSGTRAAEQRDWRSRERETRGSGDNARAEEAANHAAAAAAAPRPQPPTPPTAPAVAADPRMAGLAGIGGSAGTDTPSGGNSGQNGGDNAARGSETDPAAAFSPTPDTQRTQGPDFAQHLAAARTMRQSPQAAPQQIAVHVQRAVADGQDRLTLHLRPAELGRIDVQLEFSKDGTLKAKVLVENPATLDMLKSDARNLERALHDAGLKTDANGLNFSLRDQGGEAQRDRDQPKGRDVNLRVADSAGADPAALPQVAGPILGPGRVDVRI
ncbi:MAG: putative flagellar hook-length control protein FliK [Pseudomonadota bacterium]|jgi:flagellar hook-length control protein FliK